MKKDFRTKLLQRALIFFVLAQPILDFFIFFDTNDKNNLAVVSIPTLLRFLFVASLCGYLWFNLHNLNKKKILVIGAVMLVYAALHHLFCHRLYQGPGVYSPLGELFYLARMALPMLMIIASQSVKISEDKLEFLLYGLLFIICGTIVGLNLARMSLASYTHEFTDVSIVDWRAGANSIVFLKTATKGVFMYANQVSALLSFLLPLGLFYYIKKPNFIKTVGLLLTCLAMIMLGTRVATLSCVLSLVAALFLCLLYGQKKQKTIAASGIIVLIALWASLFAFSPMVMRMYSNQVIANDKPIDQKTNAILMKMEDVKLKNDKELLANFLNEHHLEMSINSEVFVKNYDYRNDPEFWAGIFREPVECRSDNRCIQDKISQRIAEKNIAQSKTNPIVTATLSKLFGTGYTRTDSLFPIERDFLSHFRNLGLIGSLLFVAVYVVITALSLLAFVCSGRTEKMKAAFVALALVVVFSAATFSGNTLDSLFVMLIVTFFIGQFLDFFKTCLESEKIHNLLKKVQTSKDLTTKRLKRKLLDDKNKTLLVTANPEIFEKAILDDSFMEVMNSQEAMIVPDGIGIVICGNLLQAKIKERITGVDLVKELLLFSNHKALTFSSIGADKETVKLFRAYLKSEFPKIKLGRVIDGYGKNQEKAIETMAKMNSDLVLFALGSQKQEQAAHSYLKNAKHGVAVGVGGTIDVLSGKVSRAPEIFTRLNLEWLYRIVRQPSRLGRFVKYNCVFLIRVLGIYVLKKMDFERSV